MFCPPGLIFGGAECVGSYYHVLCSQTHFWRYRGRQVSFSCFACPESFSTVPSASGPVFMFCSLGLIFSGTEGVGSRFHVMRAWTHFRRFPRALSPVFMFCAPRHVFGSTEGVGSRFHVLRARTHFLRYRGRRVLISCFVLPDSFSAVASASGPVFMFCAHRLVFDGIEGVRSCFHVLRSSANIRLYRGRQVPFSCFARPYSFSAVLRASGPVFMFCASGLVFGGTEGRPIPFSCLPLMDMFLVVPTTSGPVFLFCAPRLIFYGTEGVGYSFHVLRS
jgi:hypothetical protein